MTSNPAIRVAAALVAGGLLALSGCISGTVEVGDERAAGSTVEELAADLLFGGDPHGPDRARDGIAREG